MIKNPQLLSLIKAIVFIASIVALFLLAGCSSEPPRWKNAYIHFYPEDMDTIYVRHGRGTFQAQENGENYSIIFAEREEEGEFYLKITSYNHPIHHAYFDGFAAKSSEEIEWTFKGNTLIATGRFLSGYDFYEISLSQDKQK